MLKLNYKDSLNKYFSTMPEILCVYLFGSAARGKESIYSDIDIAILYSNSVLPSEYSDRQIVLLVELSQILDRNADVIILNQSPPYLKFQIIQEGIRIYESSTRSERAFEARSMLEYFDFLPIKNLLEASLIKRIKEA